MSTSWKAHDLKPRGRPEYSLTPMQEGMLFHRLWAPDSGVDVEQVVCRLNEALDSARFVEAFDWVIAQHSILRTKFEWMGRERPCQVVERVARIPHRVIAAEDLSSDAWEARLNEVLRVDRGEDFDMQRAPLMRLTFLSRGPRESVCIWTFHHILLDGRSFPIVLSEVFDAYDALQKGGTPRATASLPFARFVDFAKDMETEASERYFRELLSGFSAPTSLEVGFTSRMRPVSDQRHVSMRLSQEQTARVVGAARDFGVTPNTLFQAAWAILLMRYSGRDDVVFGTTRACRNPQLAGSRDMVGLLINTIPFRVRSTSEQTVGELLSAVRRQQVEQRSHEYMALSEIQRLSEVPTGSPLFESIAVFDNATLDTMLKQKNPARFAGAQFEYLGQTNFPLTLAGYLEPELLVRLEIDPARFDIATAGRMVRHVLQLLRALSEATPSTLVRDVQLLSAGEREQLIEGWNDTDGPFPDTLRMHDAFESMVARSPHATALVCRGESITYGELEARANRLANFLVARGVGRVTRVGLCLERSFDLIVAMLAVLKAGGTYVPLDPAYPEDRLRFMLEDTAAKLVLAHSQLCSRLPEDVCPLLAVDQLRAEISGFAKERPVCTSQPDDVAYIIYTSGSTGRPKGVIVRHQPALNLIDWVNTTFQVGAKDRLLFVTSVCFDLSVYDVFGMLAAGGSIHIATSEELREPRALVSLLREGGITFWDSAPAALTQLVPFFPQNEAKSTLRLVFLSGDWIPVPLPDRIRSAFPRAHVVSLGGATEATIWSNFYEIGEVDPRWPSIPYGKPIRNARYYVLDDRLEPVPVGVPGQLHIGGLCLADGYHQRPELNAEKFVDSPFLPGTKLYRTGDLSRFMPDGNLEFLGRLDLQVKVRGYRIELGEIESVLNQHPGVSTSLLDAPRSVGSERVLVAYVVPKGEAPDLQELRALCQQKLPDYMVPAHFMVLPELPMTPNGKVDRKALPAPTSQATADYLAPRNEREQQLAEIFKECLNVTRVGVFDSFFELGGHSLLAVRVISEISLRLGSEIALAKFLEQPTIDALARLLGDAAEPAKSGIRTSMRLVPRPAERAQLSYAQERLVFIQRLDPQSAAYNISLGFELRGPVDAFVMRNALEQIVQRHEPLRTCFVDVNGVQEARIVDCTLPWIEHDLSSVPESEREEALAALLRSQSARPFDLSHAPLVRAMLVRVEPERHVLSFVVHHVVFDGASTGVLLDELTQLYDAHKDGTSDALSTLPIRFNDYVVQQRESVRSDVWERDIKYWQERLVHPLPLLSLPGDHPRPRTISYRGAVLPWRLSPESARALKHMAREHSATAFNAILAGFTALLHHYSGQTDIVVGTPVSGRQYPELRTLIGLFLNTVAIRLNVQPLAPFTRLLAQTKQRCLEALEHRSLPFERLVEQINPPRDTSTTPLFQAFFSYEETSGRRCKSKYLELGSMVLDQGFSRTDLSLFVEDSQEEGIHGFFEYSTDLFDRETIAEMALGLTALLEHAVRDAETHVASLRAMSEAERTRQLVSCNQNQAAFDLDLCAVQRFTIEAARRESALAVCHAGRELSYGKLLAEVRQLATRLRLAGAGKGRGVALYLERSARLPIAMLAAHYVGAHYIPLDPSHPAERNGRVLRLSAPAVILAESSTIGSLPHANARVIDLDRVAAVPEDLSPAAAEPDGLAYVIFTSGSTGDPKGVEISQRALSNFLCSMALTPGMGTSDHVLALTTISFDIAGLELLLPLTTGASVEVLDRATALDPERLAARLAARPATLFQATPATYRMLLEWGWKGQSGLKLLCGGEALPRDLAEALVPKVDALWNMYGPTETTIWSSLEQVKLSDPVISIGRPIHNTEMYVLNDAGEPVPRGVTGMLYIGGSGVGRGYHGRADLTQAAFMRDPYALRDGARMYRTGDLARRLRDGRLECLGRNDFQVKIRGYRIELGEIETALASHPDVRQGVVEVERGTGEPRLVAYVVPRTSQIAGEAVLEHVRARVPGYMVPSSLVTLDSLPLTANGKVDRKALRATSNNVAQLPLSHVAPRDDLELRVGSVFEQLLGVNNPSVHDSFFDLGGHSLMAVRLSRELSAGFDIEVSIGTVFERPTIATLAEAIREGGGRGQATVLPLNRGRGGTPLYFICGIHVYRQLARALGEHQPCYGIFLPEEQRFFDDRNDEKATVQELARMYVESMRTHSPTGPYMLAGVSFGGLLAFEMARQLKAEGDDVPLLVLIDAVLPSGIRKSSRMWLKHQLGEFRRTGLRGFAERAERKLRQRLGIEEASHGAQGEETDLDRMRRAAYGVAAQAYEHEISTYEGTTVLIKASDPGLPGVDIDETLGWSAKIKSGLKVHQSLGDHLGVLRESLTAEILRRELMSLSSSRPSLFEMMRVSAE